MSDQVEAQRVLAETLSKVAEHLRSGIMVDFDPETGQQSHRSQWDYDAEHLVSETLHVLATFAPRNVSGAPVSDEFVRYLTPLDFGIDNSPSPGGPIPRSDYDAGCGTAPDGAYYCNCGRCT